MSLAESTVAVMLPITDPVRAKEFYAERLALPFDGTDNEGSLMFRLQGGSELVLRPLPPGAQSANTAMSFEVHDIAAEVAALEQSGVTFEDYDQPDFKTVNHILDSGNEKAAWFMDPDGNILCVHEVANA